MLKLTMLELVERQKRTPVEPCEPRQLPDRAAALVRLIDHQTTVRASFEKEIKEIEI